MAEEKRPADEPIDLTNLAVIMGGGGVLGFGIGAALSVRKMKSAPVGTKGYESWSQAPPKVQRDAARFALKAFSYGTLITVSTTVFIGAVFAKCAGIESIPELFDYMRPGIRNVNNKFSDMTPKVTTGHLDLEETGEEPVKCTLGYQNGGFTFQVDSENETYKKILKEYNADEMTFEVEKPEAQGWGDRILMRAASFFTTSLFKQESKEVENTQSSSPSTDSEE